jgi:protein CLEC16A
MEELCEIKQTQGAKAALNTRNQFFIVEVIRNIAEYAVYSEKYGQTFMETMIEENCFTHFTEILLMNNRVVNLQLIQTTSILLCNIKAPEKKYYILSHPFLNKLISFKFNFYDEEFVDTFISFLKALALQIDETTIKFFTNSRSNNFPLLAVTCKFFNHSETMVRNAMRIIVLTIFKLNDPTVNSLLTDLPFATFFVHIACYLRDHIIQVDLSHNISSQLSQPFPTSGTIVFNQQQ